MSTLERPPLIALCNKSTVSPLKSVENYLEQGKFPRLLHVLGSVDDNQEVNINKTPRPQAAFLLIWWLMQADAKMVCLGAFVDSRQMLILNVLGCWKRSRQRPWMIPGCLVLLPPPVLGKQHSVLSYSAVQACVLFIKNAPPWRQTVHYWLIFGCTLVHFVPIPSSCRSKFNLYWILSVCPFAVGPIVLLPW